MIPIASETSTTPVFRYGTIRLVRRLIDGLIFALAVPLILLWLIGEELTLWLQRLDARKLDRVATFAVGWLLVLAFLYLAFCLAIALLNHARGVAGW